jgi:hypothetical protein
MKGEGIVILDDKIMVSKCAQRGQTESLTLFSLLQLLPKRDRYEFIIVKMVVHSQLQSEEHAAGF